MLPHVQKLLHEQRFQLLEEVLQKECIGDTIFTTIKMLFGLVQTQNNKIIFNDKFVCFYPLH